ncbi:hypothetical protein AMECASPLE_036504 [Ameca splendens]|uniref:Uncharacterized protein n=1 Tax=Ameca splendens TaxID=208324 RepID=A0ABV1A3V4_9TELE
MFHSFVSSCLDNGNALFIGLDKSSFLPQSHTKCCGQTTDMFQQASPVFRVCFKILTLKCRALNSQASDYLSNLLRNCSAARCLQSESFRGPDFRPRGTEPFGLRQQGCGTVHHHDFVVF